ncbi:TonB family protein [Pseudoduganella eburnea]|uniref:TonB family protein n=1 Tax=Massilia eburnea TaxID=1776165 RepID=A0A6L6QHK3_9BURK|nr:energy transducer TonB [Massilia eburnea]MTW11146.1 TonB family protein [Massilia eburnea]
MIGQLHAVVIAFTLSMTGFAANAAETTAVPKSDSCGTPDYPAAWIDDGVEGTVRLALLVGADGSVKEKKVVGSSGYRELDKASLRASANCKFGTTAKDSSRAPGWTTVQYEWVVN